MVKLKSVWKCYFFLNISITVSFTYLPDIFDMKISSPQRFLMTDCGMSGMPKGMVVHNDQKTAAVFQFLAANPSKHV